MEPNAKEEATPNGRASRHFGSLLLLNGRQVLCMALVLAALIKQAQGLCTGCNWQCYLDRYQDRQNAFGANSGAAAESHHQNHGHNLGRDCTCTDNGTEFQSPNKHIQPLAQMASIKGTNLEMMGDLTFGGWSVWPVSCIFIIGTWFWFTKGRRIVYIAAKGLLQKRRNQTQPRIRKRTKEDTKPNTEASVSNGRTQRPEGLALLHPSELSPLATELNIEWYSSNLSTLPICPTDTKYMHYETESCRDTTLSKLQNNTDNRLEDQGSIGPAGHTWAEFIHFSMLASICNFFTLILKLASNRTKKSKRSGKKKKTQARKAKARKTKHMKHKSEVAYSFWWRSCLRSFIAAALVTVYLFVGPYRIMDDNGNQPFEIVSRSPASARQTVDVGSMQLSGISGLSFSTASSCWTNATLYSSSISMRYSSSMHTLPTCPNNTNYTHYQSSVSCLDATMSKLQWEFHFSGGEGSMELAERTWVDSIYFRIAWIVLTLFALCVVVHQGCRSMRGPQQQAHASVSNTSKTKRKRRLGGILARLFASKSVNQAHAFASKKPVSKSKFWQNIVLAILLISVMFVSADAESEDLESQAHDQSVLPKNEEQKQSLLEQEQNSFVLGESAGNHKNFDLGTSASEADAVTVLEQVDTGTQTVLAESSSHSAPLPDADPVEDARSAMCDVFLTQFPMCKSSADATVMAQNEIKELREKLSEKKSTENKTAHSTIKELREKLKTKSADNDVGKDIPIDYEQTKAALHATAIELSKLEQACATAKAGSQEQQVMLSKQLRNAKEMTEALQANQTAMQARSAQSHATMMSEHIEALQAQNKTAHSTIKELREKLKLSSETNSKVKPLKTKPAANNVGKGDAMVNPVHARQLLAHSGRRGGSAPTSEIFESPAEMSCKSGGTWTRPSGDVSNNAQGVEDCASKCAGYTYFGLECPRSTVHCQCANTLSGSSSKDVINCKSNTGPSNSHCNAPGTHGGYMMGGHGFGSVYKVAKVAAGVGTPTTAAPTTAPTSAPTTGTPTTAAPTTGNDAVQNDPVAVAVAATTAAEAALEQVTEAEMSNKEGAITEPSTRKETDRSDKASKEKDKVKRKAPYDSEISIDATVLAAIKSTIPIYTGGVSAIVKNTPETQERADAPDGPRFTSGPIAPLQPIVRYTECKAKYCKPGYLDGNNFLSTQCEFASVAGEKPIVANKECDKYNSYWWKGGTLKVNTNVGWQRCMVQASNQWLQSAPPNVVVPEEAFNAAIWPSVSSAVTLSNRTVVFAHDGQRWTAGTTNTGDKAGGHVGAGYKEPPWFPRVYNSYTGGWGATTDWDSDHDPPIPTQDARAVIQTRIFRTDVKSGLVTPAVTRTYKTGAYTGYGDDKVPRNIVSVHPLVDNSDGQCYLYVYSRSLQVQPQCQTKFTAAKDEDKNVYFQGCPKAGDKGLPKIRKNPAYNKIAARSTGCVPTGGDRKCYMATITQITAGVDGYTLFDCCIQVHHHVEKLPCSDPDSHNTKPTDNTNATETVDLLKLGADTTTVFHSSAMKAPAASAMYEPGKYKGKPFAPSGSPAHPIPWTEAISEMGNSLDNGNAAPLEVYYAQAKGFSPPYYDHLSPKMGLAVDQNSIFVLGGLPLSLKQYSRIPGSDGQNALQKSLLERLCLNACVYMSQYAEPLAGATEESQCQYGTNRWKPGTDWAGMATKKGGGYYDFEKIKWQPKMPNGGWRPPSVSLNMFQWSSQKVLPARPPTNIHSNEVQLNAGGALTMQLDEDGIATRLYGVAHCGTVFMVEFEEGRVQRVRILLHLDAPSSNPGSHLVGVFSRREVGIALQTYDIPDAKTGGTKLISKLFISMSAKPFRERFNNYVPKKGAAMHSVVKVNVNTLLECPKYQNQKATTTSWGVELHPLEETWFPVSSLNPHYPPTDTCWPNSVSIIGSQADSHDIQYADGRLIWYARASMELKSWSLNIGLPCGSLKAALASALQGWCPDEGTCKKDIPGPIMLNEDGQEMPWEVVVYRKTTMKFTKTAICSRPAVPTTRHSPEECCMSKATNANQVVTRAEITLA